MQKTIKTKNYKLNKEEKDILKSVESGNFKSVKNKKREISKYSKIAKNTLAKNKTISIRLSEIDLLKIKERAAQEGIPYQTFISSSLHKAVK